MARTALTVQDLAAAGITPSFAAANADGHALPGTGDCFVEVRNAGGASITVTIETPVSVDGLAVAEQTVVVGATTGDKLIGPFPATTYTQADGTVYIDFSAVTSVTIAAFRM